MSGRQHGEGSGDGSVGSGNMNGGTVAGGRASCTDGGISSARSTHGDERHESSCLTTGSGLNAVAQVSTKKRRLPLDMCRRMKPDKPPKRLANGKYCRPTGRAPKSGQGKRRRENMWDWTTGEWVGPLDYV